VAQQLAQSIARPHHAHLQGGYANAREPGHLVVSKIFDVLQEECLSLLWTEPCERTLDLLSPSILLRRMLLRGIVQGNLVSHEGARPAATTGAYGATPIDEDAEEPRSESLGIFAPNERPISTEEGILQRLLRILAVAEHVLRIPCIAVAIARDQLAICLHISLQDARDDRRVGATIHAGQTSAKRGRSHRFALGRVESPMCPGHLDQPVRGDKARRVPHVQLL